MMNKQQRIALRIAFKERNLRAKGWHEFLNRISYHSSPARSTTISAIYSTTPPTYIRTDDDSWEYLRNIAAGFVLIPGCGLVCRGELAQFLRENDKETN